MWVSDFKFQVSLPNRVIAQIKKYASSGGEGWKAITILTLLLVVFYVATLLLDFLSFLLLLFMR